MVEKSVTPSIGTRRPLQPKARPLVRRRSTRGGGRTRARDGRRHVGGAAALGPAAAIAALGGVVLWTAGRARAATGLLAGASALALVRAAAAAGDERRRGRELAARILAEAAEREAERALLADRLITAEHDERRRLSLFLHDGPLQALSGIALMQDAALAALRDGRVEEAERILASSLARERQTIQTLRDLSFALEPVVLRDHGLDEAVRELADQHQRDARAAIEVDLAAAEVLGEKARIALYQVVREALWQASRRGPTLVALRARAASDGGLVVTVADDGHGERRRASAETIEERARILGARVALDARDGGGTIVRVTLPPYLVPRAA